MSNPNAYRQKDVERFWSKVDKTGGSGSCWNWLGMPQKGTGYAQFEVKKPHVKNYRAHRFAWILTRGAIPDGIFVCHTCDNKICVNPEHLFLGTHQDNMDDAKRKGRLHGDYNRPCKLSIWSIRVIRRLRGVMPQWELAKIFGVAQVTICKYQNDKSRRVRNELL